MQLTELTGRYAGATCEWIDLMQSPPSNTLERIRAVALHADVVDYARHIADDPVHTIETVEVYRGIVSKYVVENSGRLADFIGDSFLALFDDARSAIAAAIGICTSVRARPGSRPLLFRMGLDAGEVAVTPDGRAFGDAINIAARIQSMTDSGGVNISERVFRELDEPAYRFQPLGPRALKNIPGEVRVYQLGGFESEEPPRLRERMAPTIAVLPFPATPGFEHTAEAVRIDLVTELVKIPGLDVIVVEEPASPARTIDRAARYILEGGLQVSGERVRCYLQLIESPTINRVWAERWEGRLDDLFELQDRVTDALSRALEVELIIGEPSRIYRDLLDPASVERVYRGWHELSRDTPIGLMNAVALFELVAETAPTVASGDALSAFALWYGVLTGLSDDPDSHLERARRHADRGAALGDPTGLSKMVRAALILRDGGDLEQALAEARESSALRPTCDVTLGVEASIERYRGNWEAAVEAARRAISMSPTVKPWFETTLSGAYYVGGLYSEAADIAERLSTGDDAQLEAMLLLAASQQALGLSRRAAATVDSIRSRFPGARTADLRVAHPFTDPAILDRWREHLGAAGMP